MSGRIVEQAASEAASPAPRLQLPAFLTRRRSLILAAMALAAAGFWLNWGWLTAVGAAPLLLALAPCAVMCGLGLCMKGGSGKPCANTPGGATPGSEN